MKRISILQHVSEWILDHRCPPNNALNAPPTWRSDLRCGSGLCCLKRGSVGGSRLDERPAVQDEGCGVLLWHDKMCLGAGFCMEMSGARAALSTAFDPMYSAGLTVAILQAHAGAEPGQAEDASIMICAVRLGQRGPRRRRTSHAEG